MAIDYRSRMNNFLDQCGLDWVALVPSTNMFYFAGYNFHIGKRPTMAFFSRERLVFLTPLLELGKVQSHPDLTWETYPWNDTEGYKNALKRCVQDLGLDNGKSVGVDGYAMRVFEWLALADAGVNMSNVKDVGRDLLMLRAIKTTEEVEAMQQAIQISETALARVLEWVQVGMTEKEIAEKLQGEMKALGAHGDAFEPIILVGERSALPHGNPGERALKDGEFLLIDFGCKINEYPSDITRTFIMGEGTDEMKRMYQAVYNANAAARAIAKPGVTWGDVDKAARDEIEKMGLGEYFTHRTGHGLGLDGHELPQIASGETSVLVEGMVFTIEPGVYLPHIGGVRIEDNMLVTSDGCISMTSFKREL